MEQFNPIDALVGIQDPELIKKLKAEQEQLWNRVDYLIHRVFAQNKDGRELLETWQKALIMTPTVTEQSTQFQAGIEEGKKTFIRSIYLTIENIEGESNAK